MSSDKVRPTAGEWIVDYGGTIGHIKAVLPENERNRFGHTPTVAIYNTKAESVSAQEKRANADLIAEAGTVLHETGLTPRALADRVKTLEQACQKQSESICQTLGKALGYPRYCDDQANFPGATEADGVCAGDHVAESLATAAAERIRVLEGERAEVEREARSILADHEKLADLYREMIDQRMELFAALKESLMHHKSSYDYLRGESTLQLFAKSAEDLIAKLEGTQGK